MIGILTFCLALVMAAPAPGQTPGAPSSKAFEVASIKLTDPNFAGKLIQTPGPGRIAFRGQTLADLVGFAFDIDSRLVIGIPTAFSATRYDVVATSDQIGTATATFGRNDVRLMLEALLVERFKLVSRRDTREVPVYGLYVANGGHRLKARSEVDAGAPLSMLFQGANLPARNVPMSLFVDGLQKAVLDRPVIDNTGLRGNFDFDLTWRPDPSQFGGRGGTMPAASDPDRADIFTAVQEQLGLKLQPEKGPTTVIVVVAVERPSED
jgi:uncharacterized protein (TIGR03435 family)